jgi:hypothetical protein
MQITNLQLLQERIPISKFLLIFMISQSGCISQFVDFRQNNPKGLKTSPHHEVVEH